VLFEETFEGEAGLSKRGWTLDAKADQSLWRIEEGALKATCHFKPYKGGGVTRQVPYAPRAEFSFEANVAGRGSSPGYDHLSLQVCLGNVMLSFKGYGGHNLMRYYEGKWTTVGRDVPKGKRARFMVRYDATKRIAEYYCGDMQYPSHVETDIEWKPREGEDAMTLRVGNYGLCTGTLVHRVDSIVLREMPEETPGATGEGVTVYRGLSFERLRAAEITAGLAPEGAAVFTMLVGLSLKPKNNFTLDRTPPVLTASRDRLILMVDTPLGPNHAMPEHLLQKICRDVANGARLVILGGPVTLGNGCFRGSVLAPLLPVELHGPWEIVEARRPLQLRSAEPGLREFFTGPERPALFHYHKVELKGDARVSVHAGDVPAVVTGPCGKGSVTVFTGAPLGGSRGEYEAYWEWPRWPEFVVKVAGLAWREQRNE